MFGHDMYKASWVRDRSYRSRHRGRQHEPAPQGARRRGNLWIIVDANGTPGGRFNTSVRSRSHNGKRFPKACRTGGDLAIITFGLVKASPQTFERPRVAAVGRTEERIR
jgi:hypothetical protein